MPKSEHEARLAVETTAQTMQTPDAAWRDRAAQQPGERAVHDRLLDEAACMNMLRVSGTFDHPPSRPIKIAAWNLERCKFVPESAELLGAHEADICLLTEMDLGMARSANRDTTAEMADILGMNHVFGVEFIELGHGDFREQAEHGHVANSDGLHGNAVLSRFAIDRAILLPLDAGGFWFTEAEQKDQRRIGGRMAIAVRHLLPEPLWVIAVHYESRLGPRERAVETEILLSHVAAFCGDEPVVIAGDFNCQGLLTAGLAGDDLLSRPEEAEPMFALLHKAGFAWRDANTIGTTTRNHPWSSEEQRPLKKIDWFFVRGVSCANPQVVAAVGDDGANLSDHELILVEVV